MSRFVLCLPPLLVAVLVVSSCSTNPYTTRGSRRAGGRGETSRQFFLYAVDIDAAAVAAGAPKLFEEPPPGTQFGMKRRAQGFFSYTDDGDCRVEVRVAEPVVGVSGQVTEHRYTLLDFFGRMDDGGRRAVSATTPGTGRGAVTELRFDWNGDDELTIQAFAGGRPQAYRYHFRRGRLPSRVVPFPY